MTPNDRHRATNAQAVKQGQPASPSRRARPTPAGLAAMIAIAVALLALMWPNDVRQVPTTSLASEER